MLLLLVHLGRSLPACQQRQLWQFVRSSCQQLVVLRLHLHHHCCCCPRSRVGQGLAAHLWQAAGAAWLLLQLGLDLVVVVLRADLARLHEGRTVVQSWSAGSPWRPQGQLSPLLLPHLCGPRLVLACAAEALTGAGPSCLLQALHLLA